MPTFPRSAPSATLEEPLVAEPSELIGRIPEAAIQDAWVRLLFDRRALRTTDGEAVDVVDPGRLNHDSGPDVTGVHLRVGRLRWLGDVEVHRTSAEWEAHGHHRDPAYNRVVLHVVLSADRRTGTLRRADGSALPELVLLPHLDRSLRSLLREFYVEPREAPHCQARIGEVDERILRSWVTSLGTERLRQRARALGSAYGRRPDLDRLLVSRVFRALGYAANADAMEELARRLPLTAVRRLGALDVHTLLVGLSGLPSPGDLFDPSHAAERFEALAGPLGLRPMAAEAWRRGGRPANAPHRRIAQAAALLAPDGLLREEPVAVLAEALGHGTDVALRVLRPDPPSGPALGRARAETVLVDAALPVLLLDAEQREDPALEAAVFETFARLPAPTDRIVRQFEDAGISVRSAQEAQGLHQLARTYCDDGRCARCAVGQSLYPGLALVH